MAIALPLSIGAMEMTLVAPSAVALARILFDDASHGVALDELVLASGSFAEGGGGEAIEVTHSASGSLVQKGRGVGGKELAFAAGTTKSEPQVFGGVVGGERRDLEALMEPRVERAIAAECEAVAKLGEPDEDEGEQGAAVPGLI